MVLPTGRVPETPSRPGYFQAGKGNILSHFAGLTTPGPKSQNQRGDDRGNTNSNQPRQRRGQSGDGYSIALETSSASTATVLARSPVDNNGTDGGANVISVGDDEDEPMAPVSAKQSRAAELSLWKLERQQEQETGKKKSARRSLGSDPRSSRTNSVASKDPPPVPSRRRSVDPSTKADRPARNPAQEAAATSSMFMLSYSPPRRRAGESKSSNQSEESGPSSSMFSIDISPPRRGRGQSQVNTDEESKSSMPPASQGSNQGQRVVDESYSNGSDTLKEWIDFMARDLEEGEKAEKAPTDVEKAFWFKKRYLDVYGITVKLGERVQQLEEMRVRMVASRGVSEMTRSNSDELRLQSLCRQVEELSQDLRERDFMIASLHNEQKESTQIINDLKMSQASFHASSTGSGSPAESTQIADLKDKVARLEREKSQSSERINTLRSSVSQMKLQLDAAQAERVHIQKSMRETEVQLETAHTQWLKERSDLLENLDTTKTSLTSECAQLRAENAQLKKANNDGTRADKTLRLQLEEAKKKATEDATFIQQVEQKLRSAQSQIAQFGPKETEIADLKLQRTELQLKVSKSEAEISQLRLELSQCKQEAHAKVAEFEQAVADYQTRILEAEIVRRSLHNKVMELKGNIRVFCRVRPVLRQELDAGASEVIFNFPDYRGERRQIELFAGASAHVGYGQSSGRESIKKYPFDFDMVFNGQCSQEDVFTEVSALIQSALDGFNVCIFAYGQTGSGKTYTMQGVTEYQSGVANPDMGIVGRAIAHIFGSIEDMKSSGWSFSVGVELIEIYNDTLRDLLAAPGSMDKVALRQDASGKPVIANSCVHTVNDAHAAWSLLQSAMGRRSTKFTNMNDHSSRSHCVISFRLNGQNSADGTNQASVIHLVDLAGSERLSKSGSSADRELLKETQHINKSLSALGNVISAVAKKSSHVPFRDSKLTHFLSPSLGGDSKTLMICNLSPLPQHRDETLNSLRFAKTVNSCEIALPSYGSRT